MATPSSSTRLQTAPTKPNGRGHFSTPEALNSPTLGLLTAEDSPLHAAHTPNFPALLRQLGTSLLVTTYQAGQLVLGRDEGDHLNAHFRNSRTLIRSHSWKVMEAVYPLP